MFFILAVSKDSGATWVDDFETKYDSGQEANKAARENTESDRRYATYSWVDEKEKAQYLKNRYRVRRIVDTDNDNFLAREAAKNLEYLDLDYRPYYELAHYHPQDRTKVRFFASVENAIIERYLVKTLPRFLMNDCMYEEGELEQILVELNYYNHDAEFVISQDADEIEYAYVNGPRSCMNDPDDYPLPDIHPSRVYAGPDLAVAIMKRKDRTVARAVVWPEKKIFSSSYGHSKLIEHELVKLGYVKNNTTTAWKGARIQKIDGDDGTICPYLDMSGTVRKTRDGLYLRYAGEDGPYSSRSCSGYLDD